MNAEMKRSLQCPECGRRVQPEDLFCPECGVIIDDTSLDEPFDVDQEASDSFEEEYQSMYQDDDEEETHMKRLEDLSDSSQREELKRREFLFNIILNACKVLEDVHHKTKHEAWKSKAGKEEQHKWLSSCKNVRGIYWVRYIIRNVRRGCPLQWLEEWDSTYFEKVLKRLNVPEFENEIKQLFENL